MEKPHSQQELIIRQATTGLFDELRALYTANASPHLPAPGIKDLARAIEEGRIIIVSSKGKIVASSAIFDFSPPEAITHVLELSATLVTPAIGGLTPINMQSILMGLRLSQYVAMETIKVEADVTQSLIVIVRKTNEQSNRNILAASFVPLVALPEWINYEELSWHGTAESGEWNYYYATDDTVRTNIRALLDLGLARNKFELSRVNRKSGEEEHYAVHIDMRFIQNSIEDIVKIADGTLTVGLSSPPDDLRFQ
jgi:hypothetical protein